MKWTFRFFCTNSVRFLCIYVSITIIFAVIIYIGDNHNSKFMEYAYRNGLAGGDYVFFFVVLGRNFFPINTTDYESCGIVWSKDANYQLGDFRADGCDVLEGVFQIMKYSFMIVQWTTGQNEYDVFESKIKLIMKNYLNCTRATDRFPECFFMSGKVGPTS